MFLPVMALCADSYRTGEGVDCSMDACRLTAMITVAANSLACNLSDEELTTLAVVFTQLGDTLATIAAVRAVCEGKESS